MRLDSKLAVKIFSPKTMAKAMQTFDRATTVVVSVCWGAAAFMMAAAIYTLMLSVSTRHATDEALVAEPSLPKIIHKPIDLKSTQAVFERMQRRFPDISFSVQGQALVIDSADGAKFRQWLSALSYVDTIAPEFHWSLDDFCVGKCNHSAVMHAKLMGDRITFEAADTKD